LPTAERGENSINPWAKVLLNVQDWIDGLLEITTQSNIATLLYHWNNRGCPFTPINFGQDAIILQLGQLAQPQLLVAEHMALVLLCRTLAGCFLSGSALLW
jgi:hypothetical protein